MHQDRAIFMFEEKAARRSLDLQVRKRELLFAECPLSRLSNQIIGVASIRRQQRKLGRAQVRNSPWVSVAVKQQRACLVGKGEKMLPRQKELQQAADPFVPQEALVSEEYQR